ncbi:hypothetical protein RKD44_001943 [Streptomyces collinus]
MHQESDGTYGSPRITAELREASSEVVNHKRVARIMRASGIDTAATKGDVTRLDEQDHIRCGRTTGFGRFPSRDFAANAVRLELGLAAIDLPAWSGGLLLDGKPATAHTKSNGCGAKSRVPGSSRPCATGRSSPRFGRSGPGRLHMLSDCLSDPCARSRAARSRRRAVVPLRCARRRPCLASRPLATVMTILFGGAVMPVDV